MDQDSASSRNCARILRKRRHPLTTRNPDSFNTKTIEVDEKTCEIQSNNEKEIKVYEQATKEKDITVFEKDSKIRCLITSRCNIPDRKHRITRNSLSARLNPLPDFEWADSDDVWKCMQDVDESEVYSRDVFMFERHPNLQPRMRSILVDWLIEVCKVYKMQRETLYLAIDFIDRYLAKTSNVQKSSLQLVGVTALFIAAKAESVLTYGTETLAGREQHMMARWKCGGCSKESEVLYNQLGIQSIAEEIYPPKLTEFSFITDGACSTDEILEQEILMLQLLEWNLTPVTVINWMNLYLQTISTDTSEEKEQFLHPQYNQKIFIQIARLLDLCIMDVGSLRYSYATLAASALCHSSSEDVALSSSGFKKKDIESCMKWMCPFVDILAAELYLEVASFSQISSDLAHNIQTHVISISLLESVQQKMEESRTSICCSPEVTKDSEIMTPPKSTNPKSTRSLTLSSLNPEELDLNYINLNSS